MVGDNAEGDVRLGVFPIMGAGDGADMLHDILDGIHLKKVAHVLHHAGQPLQSHAGVNIRGA